MFMWPSQTAILLLWILCAIIYKPCIWGLKVQCNKKDRQKLLNFKEEVIDSPGMLSTWSNKQDCCGWAGVECDRFTHRVTKLSRPCLPSQEETECLVGEFSLSNLLELEFLNYLDLSGNNLLLMPPHCCGNYSSKLSYLDLSVNHPELEIDDLTWLTRLSSLKYLNLSSIDLHKSLWLQSITMLPSLSELHLSDCQLHDINPSLEIVNFTSLQVLDLSGNAFHSDQLLPNWFFNLSNDFWYLDLSDNLFQGPLPQRILNIQNLKSLDLSFNKLDGPIPDWLGQHENLQHLDLSGNFFHGLIPKTLGNLSSLTELSLSSNLLNGSLPKSLGQLSNLQVLEVESTFLTGVISEINFVILSNLKELHLGSPGLTFHFDPHWIPSFQLKEIALGYVEPELPAWLYTQKSLQYLEITNSRLSFEDQDKFWNFVAEVEYIKLLNNSIRGDLSKVLLNSRIIQLSKNNLRGGLPQLSPNVTVFKATTNSFLGTLSPLLCQKMEGKSNLSFLEISHNHLSGELTDCWMNWKSLVHVNLANNSLTGKIPQSMSLLSNLKSLHLNKNNLFGYIPPFLKNCQKLNILVLGENKFTGNIPSWISQSLKVLLLRSNQFSGNVPPQICQLSSLIVLDIADNRLSGPIPNCLHNISTLVSRNTSKMGLAIEALGNQYVFLYSFVLPIKGNQLEYSSRQEVMCIVDLSQNNLIGTIPPEIFSLTALQSLNLSHNQLMGRIPEEIGNMKELEALDLSGNRLEGKIPQTMSRLSFLGFLNLSFNNFTGQIPPISQLQRFDSLSYIGNPELCGIPLTKNCTQEEKSNSTKPIEENEGEHEFLSSFYIGMGVGFATGFWAICASLFFNRTWRHAYFRFLDELKNQLYVFVVLKTNIFC